MGCKSLLAVAMLGVLVAPVLGTCYGNATLGNWNSDNSLEASCSYQATFYFTPTDPYENTLVVGIAGGLEGVYYLAMQIAGGISNSTSDRYSEARICIQLSSDDSEAVVVRAVAEGGSTLPESIPFSLYYTFSTYCSSLPPVSSVPSGPQATMTVKCSDGTLTAAPLFPSTASSLKLTSDSAVASPAEEFVFRCGEQTLIYEASLSDTQYITTMGLCTFGSNCTRDGTFTWSAIIDDNPQMPIFNQTSVQFQTGRQLSTSSELDVVTKYDSISFPLSQLSDLTSGYPPLGSARATVSDYVPIFDDDEEMVLTFNVKKVRGGPDFYTFTECDEDDGVFWCNDFAFLDEWPPANSANSIGEGEHEDSPSDLTWEEDTFRLFDII